MERSRSRIRICSRGTWILVLLGALACRSGSKSSVTERSQPSQPRTFAIESLGQPVRVARAWATALSPNKRGGWTFITQTYEQHSNKPPERIVLDLETGKQTVTEGPMGVYSNSNYQIEAQLRAPNGRIFIPETENRMLYYDPADDALRDLGRLVEGDDDKVIYRAVFGPDGKLYGGTTSKGLPTVFWLDPDTLQFKVIGKVGQNRNSYSYAYYLAADPPWLYVAVGQSPWELVAIQIQTGEQRILATRADDGFMQFDVRPAGITASLTTGLRTPQQKSERVWCRDGATVPYVDPPPFKPRDVRPRERPLERPPELDLSAVNPDASGTGRVRWRPSGATGPWRETPYKVKYTSPVDIESLVALPDGTLLGNAKQYHGYFRFDPKSRSMQRYGSFHLSGGPRVTVGKLTYFSGYPNAPLYVYDVSKPWTAKRDADASTNPKLLGSFVQSGTHYAYFLAPSRSGRIYYAGRRERDGVGGGVGYYEPSTGTFAGHHKDLGFLDPQGFVVLDELKRIVYSSRLGNDPAARVEKPAESHLVIFDEDLEELERLTVRPEMLSPGLLFPSSTKGVILGLSAMDRAVYRYDVAARRLLDWRDLGPAVGPVTQRASDGSLWVGLGGELVRIDPVTLAPATIGPLTGPATPSDLLAWVGDRLYWAAGSELREITVP